ncbi:MAG: DUF721 domain-containing protein [Spirochaetes bacterium]|nr:DUF721 domain-containing protein [Spirochaetota bacterium]
MKFRFSEKRQGKTISINSALTMMFHDLGLDESIVIGKVRSSWHEMAGELLAAHSIPDRIYKKILFVSVDHPVYSNELAFMKNIIIKKINEEFDSAVIKDVRLEIRKLDWQNKKAPERR